MGKFTVGNGQYVIYAKDSGQARQVISQELQRVDKIREKMANLLSKDGIAMQNFMENTSEENLNIYFNDYINKEELVNKIYSEVIKQLMIERNLSQEGLAKELCVNQTTVGQWLRGKKKPSYENILAFYTHFSITPNELFGIEGC